MSAFHLPTVPRPLSADGWIIAMMISGFSMLLFACLFALLS
jgi:hypothetical protein